MLNDRHSPADKRGTRKPLKRRQVELGLVAAVSAAMLGAATKRIALAQTSNMYWSKATFRFRNWRAGQWPSQLASFTS